MEEKKRDGSGRFSRSVDDADVLGAVRAHDPAATSEIAEEVGISRQGADRRLRSLREDGAVSSKKIGASLVWFIPRERSGAGDGFDAGDLQGDPSTTLDDTVTTPGAADAAERPADDWNAESGRTRDDSDAVELPTEDAIADATRAVVDDVTETWEDDARLRDRKGAAMAVVQYAAGTDDAVGKSHPIVDAARDAYPVDGQNAETYWRKNIRPVLKAVGDYSRGTRGYIVDEGSV